MNNGAKKGQHGDPLSYSNEKDVADVKVLDDPEAQVYGRDAYTKSAATNIKSVRQQIEMESENDIKYRTCSWQKVSLP